MVKTSAQSDLELMLLGSGMLSFIAPKKVPHPPPKSDLRQYLMAVKVGSEIRYMVKTRWRSLVLNRTTHDLVLHILRLLFFFAKWCLWNQSKKKFWSWVHPKCDDTTSLIIESRSFCAWSRWLKCSGRWVLFFYRLCRYWALGPIPSRKSQEKIKNDRKNFKPNSTETDGGKNEMSLNFTLLRTSSTTPQHPMCIISNNTLQASWSNEQR